MKTKSCVSILRPGNPCYGVQRAALDIFLQGLCFFMQLEGLIVKGVADARRYIQAQQRERALLYLRKNKMHDRNIKTIGDYLINVEQVSFCLSTLYPSRQ